MRPHLPILAFVATNKNDAAHFMIIVFADAAMRASDRHRATAPES
jgi:hypothetical protein